VARTLLVSFTVLLIVAASFFLGFKGLPKLYKRLLFVGGGTLQPTGGMLQPNGGKLQPRDRKLQLNGGKLEPSDRKLQANGGIF